MTEFPKYHRRFNNIYNKELKDKFKEKYPEYKNVKNELLDKIVRCFGREFVELVKDSREGVMLPELIGAIFIGSNIHRKKTSSYSLYNENGGQVYTNTDTDNRLMKIYFSASSSKLPMANYKVWSFKMNKIPRRYLSKCFKENWNFYLDTTGINVNTLVNKSDTTKKKKKEYNEIDI